VESWFRSHVGALVLIASAAAPGLAQQTPAEIRAQATLDQAIRHFAAGRLPDSLNEFDGLLRIAPDLLPQLWQRGIALYYGKRYADCRQQFELHRTVNPDDVENAAWHFLCVARQESPERARALLLPVGPDPRAPMREVYEMFRGTRTPDQVMAAAGKGASARFYAFLYTGLYYEAMGKIAESRKQMEQAAADQFADAGGYMHMVARVHLGRFLK
jgi:lipoprotein NlpI